MKTIEKEVKIEFEEKKSKFIGYAKPISTKIEAEKFIDMIRELHSDATHNCTVYRVIDNGQEYFKSDDDGEPSGTAGKPMAEILTYIDVNNVVVVATRYFGGIKLGAGGLVRNYAKTVKLAIQAGKVIEYIERIKCVLDFSYEKINEIDSLLMNSKSELIYKDFNERVTYKVKIPKEALVKIENMKDVIVVKGGCM